jgi:hypothetical protein
VKQILDCSPKETLEYRYFRGLVEKSTKNNNHAYFCLCMSNVDSGHWKMWKDMVFNVKLFGTQMLIFFNCGSRYKRWSHHGWWSW